MVIHCNEKLCWICLLCFLNFMPNHNDSIYGNWVWHLIGISLMYMISLLKLSSQFHILLLLHYFCIRLHCHQRFVGWSGVVEVCRLSPCFLCSLKHEIFCPVSVIHQDVNFLDLLKLNHHYCLSWLFCFILFISSVLCFSVSLRSEKSAWHLQEIS